MERQSKSVLSGNNEMVYIKIGSVCVSEQGKQEALYEDMHGTHIFHTCVCVIINAKYPKGLTEFLIVAE